MPVLSDGTIVDVEMLPMEVFDVELPERDTFDVVTMMGPPGLPGEAGPPGLSAGVEHIQSTPSASWIIPVPPEMGRTPAVTVYVGETLSLTDVVADSNSVNIQFADPTVGSAILS